MPQYKQVWLNLKLIIVSFCIHNVTVCLIIYPPLMQMIQPKNEECDHIKFLIEEKDSEEEAFYEDLDGFEENGTQETRISPYTFCKAFPFHLMFDKDLMLTQCGNAIYRVLPQVWILCAGLFLHATKSAFYYVLVGLVFVLRSVQDHTFWMPRMQHF